MSSKDLTIAVTALNATDNPGPGVGVLRSLRAVPEFRGRLVGLAYDTLDPGIYYKDLQLDAVFLLPYPSQGIEALRERLTYVQGELPIDVLIPTLDSELPAMIALETELRALGLRMLLPSHDQFELRSKVRLSELGKKAGIEVPKAEVISAAGELYEIHEKVDYPFVVKGVFYGAQVVHSLDEALGAFHATAARWGTPVIVQKFYVGEEYDVVAVGDGEGGLVGAVPMKKMFLTEKGKGWAGVAVKDPALIEMTEKFMKTSRWRGPCEVEILRTREGRYYLLEVNPRFPAWVYLAAGAGQNLPWAVAELASGSAVTPHTTFAAGTMFVRIALDQITAMADFEQMAATGEWRPTKG